MRTIVYEPRTFDLSDLIGISDRTLEMHFGLYEGYVKQTNILNEKIADILEDGGLAPEKKQDYSELTRRRGFEYSGMVLHEYYFENLTRGGAGADPGNGSPFFEAVNRSFGSFARWKADFAAVGAMRGVGWAICYEDPHTGAASNYWIDLHESGSVAGFNPLLVMDVWEHAYLLDYAPSDRAGYIDAFFANVDWDCVGARVTKQTLTASNR